MMSFILRKTQLFEFLKNQKKKQKRELKASDQADMDPEEAAQIPDDDLFADEEQEKDALKKQKTCFLLLN